MTEEEGTVSYPVAIPEIPDSPNRVWGLSKPFTQADINCMALNIYFEARGEPEDGQYVVSEVVMWRVMHENFPDSVCEVIQDAKYHKWNKKILVRNACQFSWFCDGKPDRPLDGEAFQQALDISKNILTNPFYEPKIDYALYYHADYVNPYWSDHVTHVAQVGKHHLYK